MQENQGDASGATSRRDALKLAGAVAVGSAVALSGATAAAAATPTRVTLTIEGKAVPGFREISGLESAIEVIEYKDGDNTRIRPGRVKPGKILITRDWSSSRVFYDWWQSSTGDEWARKSISIMFRNDSDEQRITPYEAWPSKWQGPDLSARSPEPATESVEVVFERMEFA